MTAQEVSPRVLLDFNNVILDEFRKPYEGWEALYGPELIAGQNVTNLLRYNQSALPFSRSTDEQVFEPKKYCHCHRWRLRIDLCNLYFTGLLVGEHGVRTIALGGRAREHAMQAVGGVKGVEALNVVSLRAVIRQTARDAIRAKYLDYLGDAFDVLPDIGEPPLRPSVARSGGKFNYRNAYSHDNADGYPTQFVYEVANCRLFYTSEMIIDPVAIWIHSADVSWKDVKCVNGSTMNSEMTISNDLIPYSQKVIGLNSGYEGPGSLLYKGDYEPPSPYVQQQTSRKRSLVENLSPPEDLEYEFNKLKVRRLKQYLDQNLLEDFEYAHDLKIGISHAVQKRLL
ncbi:peptidase s41 family protein [Colletotrichum incanum]|uniref:Peptidase s41 family protein n=1 Tax=Colletotrichum incanum TaxID=1573173 RepID=A0A162NV62_COLIC|nr:peptidase s41 family protein [Colletotrichum incanum]